jgi:hypothetical protein
LVVSSISFIQANLQHSIGASTIFTRTVSNKGIDMALIQEPWYGENCIKGLNIFRIYPVLCWRNRQTYGVHPCGEHDQLDATWILL